MLTLEEACRRYFPGKSACALRWMIKRRGYAHSRWGREYRLTPSQIAAIVADLACPADPGRAKAPRPPAVTRRTARPVRLAPVADMAGLRQEEARNVSPAGSRRALEERLSAPLSDQASA